MCLSVSHSTEASAAASACCFVIAKAFVVFLKAYMASRHLSLCVFQRLSLLYHHQPKAFYRRTVMPQNTYHRFKRKDEPAGVQPQQFKYFLVLDFEATCDDSHFPEMVSIGS